MTFDEIAAEANAAGLRITQCFQTGSGWRVFVTDGALQWRYGDGSTAADALRAAVDGLKTEAPAELEDLL